MAYDRYQNFRVNGDIKIVPGIVLDKKRSDYFEQYNLGKSRLDLISYDYYGDPGYGWLILMANPEYSSLEYQIPDGATIRIPYPLSTTLEDYNNKISMQRHLYGYENR